MKVCRLQGSLCLFLLSAYANSEHQDLVRSSLLVTALYRRGSGLSLYISSCVVLSDVDVPASLDQLNSAYLKLAFVMLV